MPSAHDMTGVGVVVLTMGTRPAELQRAFNSLLDQKDVDLDIVCVGNGWEPVNLPESVRSHTLDENMGVCVGRNAGVNLVKGDIIFFLDDDAWLSDQHFIARAVAGFDAWPALGIVQPRVHDPASKQDARRWIPRIRKGDAKRSSNAFTLWEGALFVRRSVFEAAGGFGEELFFYHEGIELAWRCWDSGSVSWYAGNLEAHHPNTSDNRHADNKLHRLMARNRVWIARRNLPAALVPIYVTTWSALYLARNRDDRRALRPWLDGWKEGWTENPGERRPMSWRTVRRMALRGRPPII